MNKYIEVIIDDGKRETPKKILLIHYINKLLFYFLIFIILGFAIFNSFLENYLLFVFIVGMIKSIFIFLFSREMIKMRRSTNPAERRTYFYYKAKKDTRINCLLGQLMYFTLTYDIEKANEVLAELSANDFQYFRKSNEIINIKRIKEINISEFTYYCYIYHFSTFDIKSILELETNLSRLNFTEEIVPILKKILIHV